MTAYASTAASPPIEVTYGGTSVVIVTWDSTAGATSATEMRVRGGIALVIEHLSSNSPRDGLDLANLERVLPLRARALRWCPPPLPSPIAVVPRATRGHARAPGLVARRGCRGR